MPRYYDFNILDDLDANNISAAKKISLSVETNTDKMISGDVSELSELPLYEIDIPLSDTIGLYKAKELCERVSFILEMSDEVVEFTVPTFYSKYPHMNKLGVLRPTNSRTANGILIFADFEKKSLRKLDRLFRSLVMMTEEPNEHIKVTDYEGNLGMYSKLDSDDESVSMLAVGTVLGFKYEELSKYEKWKEKRIKSRQFS